MSLLPAACALLALAAAPMTGGAAPRLSPLAPAPDWNRLESFQETVSRAEFTRLLDAVYAPGGAWAPFIDIGEKSASVMTEAGGKPFVLRFAGSTPRQPPRSWRTAAELPSAPAARPLQGLRIALDPGHIGGKWAKMEERWFQIGTGRPVVEGEMTLLTARHLADRLRELGADVLFVRGELAPVSRLTPQKLESRAEQALREGGATEIRRAYDGPNDPDKQNTIQWQSELLFYRTSEIRERARIVNTRLKPDLTLCLHFNAEPWGDPASPQVVEKNHFHLLLNGNYAAGELGFDDIRFDLLRRLLGGAHAEELALSDPVARTVAAETGLPPYAYQGTNAIPAGDTGYVWLRNLLANRLFDGPVLYLEPYVMNNAEVFERVQAGDYEGRRTVAGAARESLYREYARAVADGLATYYRQARRQTP